jgi:hypothetical protein
MKSAIEVRDNQDLLYAIVIEKSASFYGTQFFTDVESEFQLGGMSRNEKSPVLKHRHNLIKREINYTSEFILVRSGNAQIQVWSEDNVHLFETRLGAGDCVLFFRGYHSVTFENECEILEVKQGPYLQSLDKTYDPK